MNTKNSLAALMLGLAAAGCGTDLGDCDPNTLDQNGDGVSEGQLAVHAQCASCHSANSVDGARRGAPHGLNFDVPQFVSTERDQQVFTAGLTNVRQYAEEMWSAIDSDYMPPAGPIAAAGKEQIRNWLACGAPAEIMMVDSGSMPSGSFEAAFTLMDGKCSGCHQGAAPQGGFTWGVNDICATYDNIVSQPALGACAGSGNYIEPNNPDASVLVQKCGVGGASFCGTSVMPLGPTSLEEMDPTTYDALVAWVMAGAPKPEQCP